MRQGGRPDTTWIALVVLATLVALAKLAGAAGLNLGEGKDVRHAEVAILVALALGAVLTGVMPRTQIDTVSYIPKTAGAATLGLLGWSAWLIASGDWRLWPWGILLIGGPAGMVTAAAKGADMSAFWNELVGAVARRSIETPYTTFPAGPRWIPVLAGSFIGGVLLAVIASAGWG
jgi:hypothetical protein